MARNLRAARTALAYGLWLLRRLRRTAPADAAERARHDRHISLHRARVARSYARLRHAGDAEDDLDPNNAPRVGHFCPVCGSERRWGVAPTAAQTEDRACALARPCVSRLRQESAVLNKWWERHQAAVAEVKAETGVAVVWAWDDTGQRWKRVHHSGTLP